MARVTLRLVPNFDISPDNLDVDKYQVRKTARTRDDYEKLTKLIKEQGQVEPIQVLKENDKYYLLAGAGRVHCLRKLGMRASALVYEGLDKDGILKIAIGTNEGRKSMTAWDRIMSVGEYVDSERLNVYDLDEMAKAVKVFGRNLSNIIRDYELYCFLHKIPEFSKYLSENDASIGVLNCLDEILNPYKKDIPDWSEVAKIFAKNNRKEYTVKQFAQNFVKDFTEIAVNLKTKTLEVNKGDGLTAKEIDDVESTMEKIVAKHSKPRTETKVENDGITDKCKRLMETLYSQCENAISTMEKLLKLPYRERLSNSYMLKLSRIITKLNQTGVKLL